MRVDILVRCQKLAAIAFAAILVLMFLCFLAGLLNQAVTIGFIVLAGAVALVYVLAEGVKTYVSVKDQVAHIRRRRDGNEEDQNR